MTYPYTPEVRVVRDAALARIEADAAAGRLGARRLQDWHRERDLPPEPATVTRADWEDTVADRCDDPGDPLLDREPMGGDPRWKDGL